MKFKERGIAFQNEKEEMIELINNGISKFNNINDKRVEHIEDDAEYMSGSDTPTKYLFGDNGITIFWFENIGRCGSTEYEKNTELIPYPYFEHDDHLEEINRDIKRREYIKEKILIAQKVVNSLDTKRLDLEEEIRELKKIERKYDIDTSKKVNKIEEELLDCKNELKIKKEKLKEISNEV